MIKPLHILIDGADGTGKTTLVQMLGRYYDIPTIKMPVPQSEVRSGPIEELSEMFNKTIMQFHETDFILDRGFTSSIVYSKVFDRGYNLDYLKNIEQALNPQIFIITSGNPMRSDDIYSPDEVANVDSEFRILANDRGYTVIYVDGKTITEVRDEIITELENRNYVR